MIERKIFTTVEEAKNYYKEIEVGRAENLKDKIFGELTVLYRTENVNRATAWVCRCSCGNYTRVRAKNMKGAGKEFYHGSTSCGCKGVVKNRHSGNAPVRDYTEMNVNGWNFIKKTTRKDHNRSYYYLAECPRCHNVVYMQPRFAKLRQSCENCGNHRSLQEKIIKEYLDDLNISYEKEKTGLLPHHRFDFFVNKEYIIEYDGEQHFKYNNYFYKSQSDFEERHKKDLEKNDFCFKNNIPIIRIPYTKINEYTKEDLILKTSRFILTPENENEYYTESGFIK